MGILNIKELKKYGEKLFKGKNMDNYKFINNMTKETPMEETRQGFKCSFCGTLNDSYGVIDKLKNLSKGETKIECWKCKYPQTFFIANEISPISNKLPNKEECACGYQKSHAEDCQTISLSDNKEEEKKCECENYPLCDVGCPTRKTHKIDLNSMEKVAKKTMLYKEEHPEEFPPSDKTLETVTENWNKQASELTETYEVEIPSANSDKTWKLEVTDFIDKYAGTGEWLIPKSARNNLIKKLSFIIQSELTSATIKARQEGYDQAREEIKLAYKIAPILTKEGLLEAVGIKLEEPNK